MPDIVHDLLVKAAAPAVYAGVTQPGGLNAWWTRTCAGTPAPGTEYQLGFGPNYQWRARVTGLQPQRRFELTLNHADEEWVGTRVGFELQERGGAIAVRFRHAGWRGESDNFRESSYCWAMYLRLLKRHVEQGEVVPYERRLEA